MGLAEPSIYLDSCLAIYLVEENSSFSAKLENAVAANPDAKFCISLLTEMECLVKPIREQNNILLAKFENWFRTIEVLPIGREVFRNAARLRADFINLKTPDALHLAIALQYSCDEFWTNDNSLNLVAPQMVKNILNS